ncbi:uncharacterized protein LOC142588355 isoform X1 [Dermacentor variabilis]|uniref:uncharacterized protein LOC142588355 isoform X1 n=1 Tax=Dermacentor variabilis TaxID=34621 RepID=UPI003F5BCD97
MCTMDRSRCPDPRKRHRTASAFENAELGDDKAADVTTYTSTATSNKVMPRAAHCVSTPAATDAGTFDAVMQTEHPESPPRQPPSAPVRDASGPIQKEEPQNATLQVAYSARNRHPWHHHHHRYFSPAESRRGHHHALCGSNRQTSAAPAAPPYPSACHDRQQYPVATRGMPRMTKFGRPPMPCGHVQTAAGAMHQPPRVIGPRLYNSRGLYPLPKSNMRWRSFADPCHNAPQMALHWQQYDYGKDLPDGAEGCCNRPCVMVTMMVMVAFIAMGLVISSAGLYKFLISDTTSPPKVAPWALPEFGPWTAPVNAVLPWYQVVNANDTLYTDPRHRFACVFHADSEGVVARYAGVWFGLARFPFALCTAVLFCCPSLAANMEPGTDYPEVLAQEFLRRVLENRFPRPLLMLGNGSGLDSPQFVDLIRLAEGGDLPPSIGAWYQDRAFDGVVLRWPDSALTPSTWSKLPGALIQLRAHLSSVCHLSLAVAMGQHVASGTRVRLLAAALGAASVYLLPPVLEPADYFGRTFSYYDKSTLQTLWRHVGAFLGQEEQGSICYMLPADVLSFRVARSYDKNASDSVLPSEEGLGFGPAGNATGLPGRMAYFEACRLVRGGFSVLDLEYGVVASRDDVWLSYTTPRQMARFADALRDNLTAWCLGLWNRSGTISPLLRRPSIPTRQGSLSPPKRHTAIIFEARATNAV